MTEHDPSAREESVARTALAEITPADTIGALLERRAEDDGVLTLTFAALLSGYPGWHWSVSLAELPGEEPTVLEAELLPGDGALLAPDWVPWAERLEEYRAAQAAAAEAGEDADDDLDPDDLDPDEDFGVDPDDGIDFESDPDVPDDLEDDPADEDDEAADSAVPAARVDEQDEAEAEADDDGPEQPAQS